MIKTIRAKLALKAFRSSINTLFKIQHISFNIFSWTSKILLGQTFNKSMPSEDLPDMIEVYRKKYKVDLTAEEKQDLYKRIAEEKRKMILNANMRDLLS